jgi:hypothetical protein
MNGDRALADEQPLGDLAIGAALGEHEQHGALARAEAEAVWRAAPAAQIEQPLGDGRGRRAAFGPGRPRRDRAAAPSGCHRPVVGQRDAAAPASSSSAAQRRGGQLAGDAPGLAQRARASAAGRAPRVRRRPATSAPWPPGRGSALSPTLRPARPRSRGARPRTRSACARAVARCNSASRRAPRPAAGPAGQLLSATGSTRSASSPASAMAAQSRLAAGARPTRRTPRGRSRRGIAICAPGSSVSSTRSQPGPPPGARRPRRRARGPG